MQELNTLNGNIPVVFEESRYPLTPFPSDYQILKSEVLSADRTLMALGQRKPRCPETNSGQQIAVVAETGTGISPEHRNGHTFQRGSSRLLFPSFRKPEQGEDCESTSFEHRTCKKKMPRCKLNPNCHSSIVKPKHCITPWKNIKRRSGRNRTWHC